jgi:hypothetical protein
MEQSDDIAVDPGAPPVFVDDTGRRRARARRVGRILVLGFVGYLALLAAGFARDPKLGAFGLPTFGLPGLVHPQSAPTVLGEATTRPSPDTAGAGAGGDATLNPVSSKATRAIDTTARRATPAGPAAGGGAGPGAGQPIPGPAPAAPATGQPAPTTTTSTTATTVPANPGHGSKGSTTTTSTTPTTTAPTTSTTTPPGQANAASGKGPDGSGAPGQLRRPTTTTTVAPAGG